MTFVTRALQLKNAGASAEEFRRMQYHVWGQAKGPWLSSDLTLSVGTGLTVDIGEGAGVVHGTTETYQGAYFVENRGTHTVTIAAADPSDPRWDLIVVTVLDTAVAGAGATNEALPQVITGTPAGSPTVPATPANSIALGYAVVPASATTPSSVVDLRTSATGQTVVAKSAYGGVVGEATYNTDPSISGTAWMTLTPVTVDVRDGYGHEVHLQPGDWYELGADGNVEWQCDVGSTRLVKVDAMGGSSAVESHYGAGYVSGLAAGSTSFNIQTRKLSGAQLRKDTGGAALKAWVVERPA